ncbi:MAG: helix-turn-helix transcriptional regulator [Steroidobacteraceae bacterium]
MSNAHHGGSEITRRTSDDVERLCQLVRSVVAIACSGIDPAVPSNEISEHVVFDLDVDGDRYILIKTVPAERGALSLSPREWEIVRMVALGHQNKVIAGVLNISSWTVCTHVRRVFAKLGVSSRAAMVAKVAEYSGVIDAKGNAAWLAVSRDPASVSMEAAPGAEHRRTGSGAAKVNASAARISRKEASIAR